MQTLLTIAAAIGVIYLAAALSLYLFQRKLIYYPDAAYYTPADAGLSDVREVRLDTPDGASLLAWWSPARPGQPTLLYFHGNAGSLLGRADRIKRFAAAGFGVFMPAYRGYGGSTGAPSETALIADAQLAHEHLRQAGIAAADIIPYGESLGSGVAVQLAATRPVGALILDAPYTSLPDVGKALYPIMPVEMFMVDRFESKRHIAGVEAPILILHGSRDQTIPLAFGEALFEAAPEPKEMAVIEGAGHSDIYLFGAFAQLKAFIERHRREADMRQPVRGGRS